jgi:hypothetical protein
MNVEFIFTGIVVSAKLQFQYSDTLDEDRRARVISQKDFVVCFMCVCAE